MTRSFLFGGASSSQSQNKYLVEFRAGKMTMKNMIVSADKRKGLVFVYQTDDSLMHFCWKDRTTGIVEDDLIIFPDDVVFKRVPECTTGRVFVLKFKSSSRRCFYWLQEPKTDRDNEFCCKVNQYLNNPPVGSARSGTSGSLGGSSTPSQSGGGLQSELSTLGDGDLQNLLNNMSQSQLIQLLGGVGGIGQMSSLSSLLGASRPSSGQSASSSSESTHSIVETTQPSRTTTSTTTTSQSTAATPTPTPTPAPASASASASASTTSSSSIQLSDLQNILSGLTLPPQGENQAQKPSVDLSSAITAEALQPLFNNQELMERVRSLLPQSSESATPVPSDQLRSTVQSPQFQQALGMFSAALQSGQLGPLMQQFGMSSDVVNAANSGDMDAFVRALQSSKENPSESSKDKKDQDKDEDMALD
ncbi:proteasomal ubiquitin receptor ADRM1-A-like [Argiope bruennichi]|uniref:proteasomal ubiquitin receptor ADRM1-A-like n=1 Tax=Argiope bruennichi TaxID=94029 RepID=UPI002495197A|nr:proteasomal ubiquitin receptor ADRM1-A-like [Argiope bruennichi]